MRNGDMREFSDYTLNLISFRNCIHYLNSWFHEKNHNRCDVAITLFDNFVLDGLIKHAECFMDQNFDAKPYVFSTLQILPSSGEIKRPGGYQNVSLQIGPPIRYENAGRYICLVNNPEGHAHKEMFLEIDHASFDATRDYNQGM